MHDNLASLQVSPRITLLPGLVQKKDPGIPDQKPDPDLTQGLDQEEVLVDIIQDHALALGLGGDQEAGHTVETIEDVAAIVILLCLLGEGMLETGLIQILTAVWEYLV